MHILKRILLLGIVFPLCLIILINLVIILSTNKYVYQENDTIPSKHTALILGAKTYNGYLSSVLKDRVDAGISLVRKNQAKVLLLSGDHGRIEYDEVNNMKQYVLKMYPDLENRNIFLDHAGFDTYDSIVRAKEIFCVDSVIIVTQSFHINRALYIARSIGIDAIGLSLSESAYDQKTRLIWISREILARIKAFFDVLIKSKPKFLGEKIPVSGDGRLSWD